MATNSTAICNLALMKMGQDLIDDIAGSDVLEEKCNLLYTQALEELTTMGPEQGWKFARRRTHSVADNAVDITAFASASATTTTVTATHTFVAGDKVVITGTTSYDGEYTILSVSTTVSFVITATYVADDATGSARWTSEQYEYRFAIPTSLRIDSVQVGGVELTDWVREGNYLLTNQESTEVDMAYIQSITDTTQFPPHFTRVLVLMLAIKLHYNLTQDLRAIQLLEIEYDKAMSKAMAMDEREKYVREYSTSWVDMGRSREVPELNGDNAYIEDSRYNIY